MRIFAAFLLETIMMITRANLIQGSKYYGNLWNYGIRVCSYSVSRMKMLQVIEILLRDTLPFTLGMRCHRDCWFCQAAAKPLLCPVSTYKTTTEYSITTTDEEQVLFVRRVILKVTGAFNVNGNSFEWEQLCHRGHGLITPIKTGHVLEEHTIFVFKY